MKNFKIFLAFLLSFPILLTASSGTSAVYDFGVSPFLDESTFSNSMVFFQAGIKRCGREEIAAGFQEYRGEIWFDENLSKITKLEFIYFTTNIYSAEWPPNPCLENYILKLVNFLNPEAYERIEFKSKEIKKVEKDPIDWEKPDFEVRGDLTINGITKEVVIKAEGYPSPWEHTDIDEKGNFISKPGYWLILHFDISMKDFGINLRDIGISNKLYFTNSIHAVKRSGLGISG